MRLLCLLTALLCASCPSARSEIRTGPPRAALADPGLPALALAPRQCAYFVAVRRLSSLTDSVRTLIGTLRALDTRLTADNQDRELRKSFGASPLQGLEVEDAGLDPAADAAVFSTGVSPTLAFKIADEARLSKFLAERTKSLTTYIKSHGGVAVTSWKISPDARGSFLRLRGYLLVHLELEARPPAAPDPRKRSEPGSKWLDEIIAAAGVGSGPEALGQAVAVAGVQRDVLVYLDPARVLASTRSGASREAGCAAADAEIERARWLAAGIALRGREAKVGLKMALTEPGRRELEARLPPGPHLPASLWDPAPARIEWQLDPTVLTAWIQRVGKRVCGPLHDLLGGLRGLTGLVDQYRPALEHAGRAVSAALLAVDEKGQGTLLLRGALIGRAPDPSDRAYLERQLPLAAGEHRVAGRPVRRISGNLTLAEGAQVSFGDGLVRLAAGEGLMQKLLGRQREAPPAGRGILRLDLEPGKLADLRAALKLVDDATVAAPSPPPYFFGFRRSRSEELDQLAAWLASFSLLSFVADLRDATVQIEARYGVR